MFALGKSTLSGFQQSARLFTKQPEMSTVCHFRTAAPLFCDYQQSARVYKNSLFSPRSARFVIFALSAQLCVIFALGRSHLSGFQQSAGVFTKQ